MPNVYGKIVASGETALSFDPTSKPAVVYSNSGGTHPFRAIFYGSPGYSFTTTSRLCPSQLKLGKMDGTSTWSPTSTTISCQTTSAPATSLTATLQTASTASAIAICNVLITARTGTVNSTYSGWWDQSASGVSETILIRRPGVTSTLQTGGKMSRYQVEIPQSGVTNLKIYGDDSNVTYCTFTSVTVFHFAYNSTSSGTSWVTVNTPTGTTYSSSGVTITCSVNNTAFHRTAVIILNYKNYNRKCPIVLNQPGIGPSPSAYSKTVTLPDPGIGSVYLPKGYNWGTYELWWMPSWDYINTEKEPYIAGRKLLKGDISLSTSAASTSLAATYIRSYVLDGDPTYYEPFNKPAGAPYYYLYYQGPKNALSFLGSAQGRSFALQTVMRDTSGVIVQKSCVTHITIGLNNSWVCPPAIPEKITEIWIDDNWEHAMEDYGYMEVADYFYDRLFPRHATGNDSADPFDGANKFIPAGTDVTYNGVSYELWEGVNIGFYGLLSKTCTREDLWKMSAEANPMNRNCPFFMMLNSDKTEYHPQGDVPFDEIFDLLCVR